VKQRSWYFLFFLLLVSSCATRNFTPEKSRSSSEKVNAHGNAVWLNEIKDAYRAFKIDSLIEKERELSLQVLSEFLVLDQSEALHAKGKQVYQKLKAKETKGQSFQGWYLEVSFELACYITSVQNLGLDSLPFESGICSENEAKAIGAFVKDHPEAVFFPTWRELSIQDFLELTGIPVLFFGQSTKKLAQVDGAPRTPASFWHHDLNHARLIMTHGFALDLKSYSAENAKKISLQRNSIFLEFYLNLGKRFKIEMQRNDIRVMADVVLFSIFHEDMVRTEDFELARSMGLQLKEVTKENSSELVTNFVKVGVLCVQDEWPKSALMDNVLKDIEFDSPNEIAKTRKEALRYLSLTFQ
jgi:hypothetical protein